MLGKKLLKKIYYQKKIWSRRFWFRKNSGPLNLSKKDLVQKNFVIKKVLVERNFGPKKWFNNAKAPKNWVQNIWSKLGHYQLRYCRYGKSCLDKCPCDISHLLEKVSGTGQMSPSHLKSVHNGPRYLHLKFGQNPVSNS